MAEHKYDLALQEKNNSSITRSKSWHINWYNECKKPKYLKQVKPGERIHNYDTKNWLFVKRGLDDFRDGLPPIGISLSQTNKGLGPVLKNEFVSISDLKQPPTKRLTKYQIYLSRHTPQKQRLKNYIDSVEQGLLEHPLALFPHLEHSVAPEQRQLLSYCLKLWYNNKDSQDMRKKIFENILDILDPQISALDFNEQEIDLFMKPDDDTDIMPIWSNMGIGTSAEDDRPKLDQALGLETSSRNLYRWLPQKENLKDSKKNKEKEKIWPSSQTEEEHIKQFTREFCDWVSNLGGETNNIEESTMTSLFASGYDTKPALSVPIHVVDLANVPHELRLSAMVPPPAPPEKQTFIEDVPKKKVKGGYAPRFFKFRYGAWYLKPNTWKKMGFYESLEDPKQLKAHEMSEAKAKCHELTEELASMHASKAFDDFISKRNTRKPEFLTEIVHIQKKAALEAERRAESEMLVKQKKNISKQKINTK